MAGITQWAGDPVQGISGWTLLTPNPNTILTTIAQLGPYTITTLGALTLTQGYMPPSGTSWSRV